MLAVSVRRGGEGRGVKRFNLILQQDDSNTGHVWRYSNKKKVLRVHVDENNRNILYNTVRRELLKSLF